MQRAIKAKGRHFDKDRLLKLSKKTFLKVKIRINLFFIAQTVVQLVNKPTKQVLSHYCTVNYKFLKIYWYSQIFEKCSIYDNILNLKELRCLLINIILSLKVLNLS